MMIKKRSQPPKTNNLNDPDYIEFVVGRVQNKIDVAIGRFKKDCAFLKGKWPQSEIEMLMFLGARPDLQKTASEIQDLQGSLQSLLSFIREVKADPRIRTTWKVPRVKK